MTALDEKKDEEERGNWSNPIEFIFTCIGFAVGLGNVWRFPYLCYKNGGGAFLIPYSIMLFFVGLPLFYLELCFGQYAAQGPISIWKVSPLFKGLGYCSVLVSAGIALYYNVVVAYAIYFLFASFTSVLPWTDCENPWNTEHCVVTGENTTLHIDQTKSPSEEYFYNEVLKLTDGIDDLKNLDWRLSLTLLMAWLIVLVSLIKGIQSLGKVVYFTALFPYVMLTILFVRSVQLDGATDGIWYYVTPQWERLAQAEVWRDAAVQIFYSLSACSGGLIAMASFNKFHNNVFRDSMIVPFLNCGTSIYAGFLIFSVLGFMAFKKGPEVGVADVAEEGPGLVFVVYPEALSQMPISPLWSVLFFLMLCTLGFGSIFSMVECVISAFIDEFPGYLKPRSLYFRFFVIALFFLGGLPMVTYGGLYVLNLIDTSIGGFPLLVVGFSEVFVLNWVYGFDNFANNIHEMLGFRPGYFWKICWKYLSPLLLLVVLVFNMIDYKDIKLGAYAYPRWALSLGWMITMFPIIWIPVYFLYWFCRKGGYQDLKLALKPRPDWGPAIQTTGAHHDPVDIKVGDWHATSSSTAIAHDNPTYTADKY